MAGAGSMRKLKIAICAKNWLTRSAVIRHFHHLPRPKRRNTKGAAVNCPREGLLRGGRCLILATPRHASGDIQDERVHQYLCPMWAYSRSDIPAGRPSVTPLRSSRIFSPASRRAAAARVFSCASPSREARFLSLQACTLLTIRSSTERKCPLTISSRTKRSVSMLISIFIAAPLFSFRATGSGTPPHIGGASRFAIATIVSAVRIVKLDEPAHRP